MDVFDVEFAEDTGELIVRLSDVSDRTRSLDVMLENIRNILIKLELSLEEGSHSCATYRQDITRRIPGEEIRSYQGKLLFRVELYELQKKESILLHLRLIEFRFRNGKKEKLKLDNEYPLMEIVAATKEAIIKRGSQQPVNSVHLRKPSKPLISQIMKPNRSQDLGQQGSAETVKDLGAFFQYSEVKVIPEIRDLIHTDREKEALKNLDELDTKMLDTHAKSGLLEVFYILIKSLNELVKFGSSGTDSEIQKTMGKLAQKLLKNSPTGVA